jgi:membrane associated rhomboid family serine protease
VLLALCFAATYSAANYWFVISTGWLPLDRNVANGWLPGMLGLILTGAFIAPRLRALKAGKNGDVPSIYYIVAAATLIAPTCLVQYYLTSEIGGLIHVDRAEMIATAPEAAYYTATSVCVDKPHALVTGRRELSGRHNESLDFKLYVLLPVCGPGSHQVWVALRYNDSVDSGATEAVKEAERDAFGKRTEAEVDALDFANVKYFERMPRTTDRRIYEKLLAKHGASLPGASVILVPHEGSFENRSGHNLLPWSIRVFGGAAGLFLLMVLFRGLNPERVEDGRLRLPTQKRGKTDSPRLFLPSRDNYGLPVLADLNLGVYVAMVLSGLGVISFQSDDLLAWGANYGPAIHGLGAYRLVTSQFVHGGLMHILPNMYGLFFGGLFLSPVLRKWGLILAYLICGSIAAVASEITQPTIVSIGASGSIMGLFGILLVLAVLGDRRVVGMRSAILANCVIFAGLTIFMGVVTPGIDNTAHVAGFVAGMVLGLPIFAFSWGEPFKHEVEDDAAEDAAPSNPVVETPTTQ